MYHLELAKCSPVDSPDVSVGWKRLVQKTKVAAASALKKRAFLPQDKGCRLLVAKVAKAQFWMSWKPLGKMVDKLSTAKLELQATLQRHDEQAWTEFFQQMGRLPLGVRMRRTQQCFKRDKHQQMRLNRYSSVPINSWRSYGDADGLPQLIDASDGEALPPGPTLDELRQVLTKLGNGKSSGQDRLPSEYLKYADEAMLNELLEIITTVWSTNCMSGAWKLSAVVPIPKVSSLIPFPITDGYLS